MDVIIFIQVAISCGVVIVYSFVGKYFIYCLGLRRQPEPPEQQAIVEEEVEEEEEEDVIESDASGPSPDAIHLLRLSNAFCPSGVDPPTFGYDFNLSGHNSSADPDELLCKNDTFSDVFEESSFCLRESFEHGRTHRISINAPTFIHQPSTAEVSTEDHKSTSSERRSSITFAPEANHENEKAHHRLFSLIAKGSASNPPHESGTKKKMFGYYHKSSCGNESNGVWDQLTSKRKKLFTVRPSINALQRLSQSKQVHQVDQPKLFTNPSRIDYMNTVRTRFKLIHSKKLTSNPKIPL